MNQIDELIRSFDTDTPDERAQHAALEAARRALRSAIAAEHVGKPRWRRIGRRRALGVALAAAVAIGLAVPAFGVVGDGWIGVGGEIEGIRGSAAPKLTGPPVVVASGEPREPWTILVARSNQGLCLNTDDGDEDFDRDRYRLGDCGYLDIHGDFPSDVRGDPLAPCIGLTELVPCGSRRKFWVQYGSGGYVPEIRRTIVTGAAAADVVSIGLVLANGGTLEAQVVERPLGPDVPLNVYWAKLGPEDGLRLSRWRDANGHLMPCLDVLVKTVVARDSEGRVLGRRIPAWNGNPNGDPAGPRGPGGFRDTECV
jgi:hypothetical protein